MAWWIWVIIVFFGIWMLLTFGRWVYLTEQDRRLREYQARPNDYEPGGGPCNDGAVDIDGPDGPD